MKRLATYILISVVSFIGGCFCIWKFMDNVIKEIQNLAKKDRALFLLLKNWINNSQNGKKISDYFLKKNIKTIAIYGMGYVGELLYAELSDSNVTVCYGIDRAFSSYEKFRIYRPNDVLPKVDMVIVTAVTYYKEVKQQLEKQMDCPVISLQELILEL